MKKTISITLSGMVFAIEEDAYHTLDAYLRSIQAHYEEDIASEILHDIEASIADKFTERISKQKQVITQADVDEVIEVMGDVGEIAGEETDEDEAAHANEAGFGKHTARRLYRDPDDVIVAGVASGIGAYFDVDPLFIRLVFVLFAFLHGFGIWVYLLLWIITPSAKTHAQKLEMRGKRVTLAEIQEVVKERSETFSEEGKEAIGRLRNNSFLYRALQFPIRVAGIFFGAVRNMVRALGPIVSVVLGMVTVLASALSVAGITVLVTMSMLHIDSSYIISDIPLHELATKPFYFIGVVSLYLVALIPLLFALMLGTTLLRRKNQFTAVGSGALIAVWIISLVVFLVSLGDMVPWVYERVDAIEREQSVTRTFEYTDFSKLYIDGTQEVTVTQGDSFSITYTGRTEKLDALAFAIEEGQLQITEPREKRKGICIFCFDRPIRAEIVMPALESYVGIGASEAELRGFSDDIYVQLGESADATIDLEGQTIEGSISGANATLYVSGDAHDMIFEMNGRGRLFIDRIKAEHIELTQSVFSYASLSGDTDDLMVTVEDSASCDARALKAETVTVLADDYAHVSIWPQVIYDITSDGDSHVEIRGAPVTSTPSSTEG